VLDLYRLRLALTDLALYASDFRRPHARTADDDRSWELLSSLLRRVSREDRG
jgi:hypothetical protein